MKEYNKTYYQTIKGKASRIWLHILERVEKPPFYRNIKVKISKEEFMDWILPELTKWKIKYNSLQEVSIDRINNSGHYETGNLQLITRSENRLKQDRNKNLTSPKGFAWCGGHKSYLPLIKFGRNAKTRLGVKTKCEECELEYQKQYRLRKKEDING